MQIVLLPPEIDVLFRQDPDTAKDGGWQSLMVRLQGKCDRITGHITLDAKDMEQIPKYAFDYKNGGWEDRLIAIFSRTLGPRLGR